MKKYKTAFIFVIVVGVIVYAILMLWDKVFEIGEETSNEYNSSFDSDNGSKDNAITGSGNQNNDDFQVIDEENETAEGEETNNGETEEDRICNERCADLEGSKKNDCLINCRKDLRNEELEDKNCGNLAGEAAYACVRDKAIKEKNSSLCEQLKDPAYKEKCEKAVVEILMEQM
ncbi:MAG: hypothetical protein GF347_03815 [Candidatus Moranbacteria bacterium]|nr:hypothetical protein [Candidatus Moranbacteria bacterium]